VRGKVRTLAQRPFRPAVSRPHLWVSKSHKDPLIDGDSAGLAADLGYATGVVQSGTWRLVEIKTFCHCALQALCRSHRRTQDQMRLKCGALDHAQLPCHVCPVHAAPLVASQTHLSNARLFCQSLGQVHEARSTGSMVSDGWTARLYIQPIIGCI
jgi:hypothetical protein